MLDDVLLLHFCGLSDLLRGHKHFVFIESRENVPHPFQREPFSNQVYKVPLGIFENLKSILFTDLRGFVDSFDIDSYSIFEVWVLGVVTVEVPHSLLVKTRLLPSAYKRTNVFEVHKGNVINVPEGLSAEDNGRGQTLVAHAEGVRLVVRAVVLNLVAQGLDQRAVLALLGRQMFVLTPLFHFD